jgi:hypothetical protein
VRTARGLLFHAGVGEADEFFTISVWESQESYDEFAPVFKQAMAGKGFDLRHSRHAYRASHDRPVELTRTGALRQLAAASTTEPLHATFGTRRPDGTHGG